MNEKPQFWLMEPDLCKECRFSDFTQGKLMRCKRKRCDNHLYDIELKQPHTILEFEKRDGEKVFITKCEKESD